MLLDYNTAFCGTLSTEEADYPGELECNVTLNCMKIPVRKLLKECIKCQTYTVVLNERATFLMTRRAARYSLFINNCQSLL